MGKLKLAGKAKQYAYFKDHFERFHTTSNGWCEFNCICGRDKNMAVNFDSSHVKCWSAKCPLSRDEYSGSIVDFLQLFTKKTRKAVWDMLANYKAGTFLNLKHNTPKSRERQQVELPYGFRGINDSKDAIGKRARAYLKKRGFDLELLDSLGFGYVDQPTKPNGETQRLFGFIIVPFRREGELYYYIGRNFLAAEPRYYNPPLTDFGVGKAELLFNEDALNEFDEIYLVEGWACAMTIGENGVACLGSYLSEEQRSKIIRSSVKTVVIVPDYGAYTKGEEMALSLLGEKEVYLANMDEIVLDNQLDPDVYNDVNSIGVERLMFHVEQLTEFTEDSLWGKDSLPFM